MSGNKCSYLMCGKTSRTHPGIRKFAFPVNDSERCSQWIIRSGNLKLMDLSPKSLKKKFICGEHFRREDFMKRKLTVSAVPLPIKRSMPSIREYRPSLSSIENLPSTSGVQDMEYQEHEVIRYLTPEINVQQHIISPSPSSNGSNWAEEIMNIPSPESNISKRKSKSNLMKTRKLSSARDLNTLTKYPRALVRMQLHHRPQTPWLKDEKNVAISMYYKSPSLYRFLRKQKVLLPSESIIKKWIDKFNSQPGFNKSLFARIKLKAQTMTPQQRKCVLLFDEMAIKQSIEYSQKLDIIVGFEDLGKFGKKNVPAKQALVVMARGIYSQWKIPVAYFFSEKGVTADQLFNIVKEALRLLDESTLNPISIVCDQSSSNQSLYKKLGINVENPFFFIGDKKYYGIYDVPHLIKSLRNNFIESYYIYDDKKASYFDVKKLYSIDKRSSTGRALIKLTDKHLNPNSFQKMNVRLAVQLFSHSVSAAMKTAIKTKELISDTAHGTAEFIEKIDNLFDALNSRHLSAVKPCNAALSDKHKYVHKALNEGYEIFKNLKKIDSTGKESRPPSFNGMLISINAIKMIHEDEKKEGYSYLLTNRFNQDALENLFSIYRQRGGYNPNPTARTFRATFKLNTTINLMKPPKSNCEEDKDYNVFEVGDCDSELTEHDTISPTSTLSPSSSGSSLSTENDATLETCSTIYFAGYLLKKCLDKFNCVICKAFLQGDAENNSINLEETLIFFKNFSIESEHSLLQTPSPILRSFTEICMKRFSKYFQRYWGKKVAKSLKLNMIKVLKKKVPDWFIGGECEDHRYYVLKLLIKTLIFKECKTFSSNLKFKTIKKSSKLKILLNE